MGWIALTAVLALTVLVLGLSLLSLRRALREVAEELEEKLAADTNTLITLSTGDRAVRALAARINTQLHALRAERLRLRNGQVWLMPENPDYSPIDGRDARILGRVRAVVREY